MAQPSLSFSSRQLHSAILLIIVALPFTTYMSSTRGSGYLSLRSFQTTSQPQPVYNFSDWRIGEASYTCTASHAAKQRQRLCSVYAGRHNVAPLLPYLRYLMPRARTFVDVGANKGLVSARFLELWRPDLGITARSYALDYVKKYFVAAGQPSDYRSTCGITDMCSEIHQDAISKIQSLSLPEIAEEEPFTVHSFEPSMPLFEMHRVIRRDSINNETRSAWRWYRLATSDFNGRVHFSNRWDEGSAISLNTAQEENNTDAITLDTLAYRDNIFEKRTIDIFKIDAEQFDAHVIAGASRLLAAHRIRVLTWETPNRLPVTILGKQVETFGELIDVLDRYALMTCYFPGQDNQMIKITGCWELVSNITCKNDWCPYGNGCKPDHSNALCVHRKRAKEVVRALEDKSIIY